MTNPTTSIIHPANEPPTDLIFSHPPTLDQHPAAAYLQRLPSNDSRRTMGVALTQLATLLGVPPFLCTVPGAYGKTREVDLRYLICNWGALRYRHTSTLRTQLMQQYAFHTVNVRLAALRGVLKEAWRLGLMDGEAYQRAVDIQDISGEVALRGRALDADELYDLIYTATAENQPIDIRDRALLAILFNTGLRRAELASVRLADYTGTSRALQVTQAKGRKVRTVYVGESLVPLLTEWLSLRGPQPGPLFCQIGRWGDLRPQKPLGPQSIYKLVVKRGQILEGALSPHDLRRTAITMMLDEKVDVLTVTAIAGHASTDTTWRYDRRGNKNKQAAADRGADVLQSRKEATET